MLIFREVHVQDFGLLMSILHSHAFAGFPIGIVRPVYYRDQWVCAIWTKLGPRWVRPWVVRSWAGIPFPLLSRSRLVRASSAVEHKRNVSNAHRHISPLNLLKCESTYWGLIFDMAYSYSSIMKEQKMFSFYSLSQEKFAIMFKQEKRELTATLCVATEFFFLKFLTQLFCQIISPILLKIIQ